MTNLLDELAGVFDNLGMEKLTKAEREARRKLASAGGKALAKKLTVKQRKARARAAGIASGKARRKKAGKK